MQRKSCSAYFRFSFNLLYVAIFPLLTKTRIVSQENVYKLRTKMILPSTEGYDERLNILSPPPLALFSETFYQTHILKIISDVYLPYIACRFISERQSVCRRHSSRLKDSIVVRTRATKRQQSTFFMNL